MTEVDFLKLLKRAITAVVSAAIAAGTFPVFATSEEAPVYNEDITAEDTSVMTAVAEEEPDAEFSIASDDMEVTRFTEDPDGNSVTDENGYIISTYGYSLKGDPYNVKQVKQGIEYSASNKKLHDPYWINDENLFGVWDGSKWSTKPKLDYDSYESLADVEAAAKEGDYDNAKLQLYNYYILKERSLNRKKSITSAKKDDITAELLLKNYMYNANSGITPVELMYVGNTPSYVSGDITETVTKYLGTREYLTFWITSTDKNGDSAVFNSKEAETDIPYLQIKVNGTDKIIYPTADTMIKAGDNKNNKYGSEPVLVAHEDAIDSAQYLVNSETSRIYLKFDVSELVAGDTVTAATFNIFGNNLVEGKEREVVLFYSDDSAWDENAITYANATAQVIFSYDQNDSWLWNQPTNAGFRYQEELLRFNTWFDKLVKMYNVTGDEKYAYTALRLFMDYIYVRGDDPCWLKSLDVAVRTQCMPGLLLELIESDYMTPDIFTGIVKWMYVQAYCSSFFTRGTNWGLNETQGLYTIAINFPEFSLSQSWRDRVKSRYESLSSSMMRSDLSCTELSLGYTDYSIDGLVGSKNAADAIGFEEYPYSDKTLEVIKGLGKFEYYSSMPGVKDNQVGDGYSHRGGFKSRMSYLGEWFDDDEFRYAGSSGEEGAPPPFTSHTYPVGKKIIMRTGWDDNSMYLFTESDGGVGTHAHPDDNNIVVMAYGQYLLVDPLYGTYSGSSIADWLTSTKAHNVVTVNGSSQAHGSSSAAGTIDRWETNNLYDFSQTDSPATAGIESYKRSVLFIRNHFWLVNDYLVPDNTKSNTFVQGWHYLPEAEPSIDGDTKTSRTNMAGVNINVVPVKPEEFSRAELVDGYYSEGQGSIISAKYTEYEKKQTGTAVFNTVLMPENKGESYDIITSPITVAGMDETDASAYEIYMTDKVSGKISHYQYYQLHNKDKASTVIVDNYKTDATMLFVELNDDGGVKFAVAQDASYLQNTINNSYVFKNDKKLAEFSIDLNKTLVDIASSTETAESLKESNLQFSAGGNGISSVMLNESEIDYVQSGNAVYIGAVSDDGETEIPVSTPAPTKSPTIHAGGSGGGGGGGGGSYKPTAAPTEEPEETAEPEETEAPGETEEPEETEAPDSIKREMSVSMFDEISGHWAETEIAKLYNEGIIEGKDNGTFGINDNITRAEFVTLLVRAMQLDIPEYNNEFSDVSKDDWYAGYIAAAFQNGIMSGSDGKAMPNADITREEMAVMLSALVEADSVKHSFNDSSEISSWAESAVDKVCTAGLMNGRDDDIFAPKANTKRSEAFVVIYRLLYNN